MMLHFQAMNTVIMTSQAVGHTDTLTLKRVSKIRMNLHVTPAEGCTIVRPLAAVPSDTPTALSGRTALEVFRRKAFTIIPLSTSPCATLTLKGLSVASLAIMTVYRTISLNTPSVLTSRRHQDFVIITATSTLPSITVCRQALVDILPFITPMGT